MTWGDCKLIALQRMFSVTTSDIPTDSTTMEYIYAMPGAANEALALLSTAGRYIVKSVQFSFSEPIIGTDGKEIQIPLSGLVHLPLSKLTDDFYLLDEDQLYYEEGDSFYSVTDFNMEGEDILLLPRSAGGTFTAYYFAYPPEITQSTNDNYELPLLPEVAVLVPLYIGSQLYKEDDVSIAAQLRNEFEVGREELKNRMKNRSGVVSFRSVTGWI